MQLHTYHKLRKLYTYLKCAAQKFNFMHHSSLYTLARSHLYAFFHCMINCNNYFPYCIFTFCRLKYERALCNNFNCYDNLRTLNRGRKLSRFIGFTLYSQCSKTFVGLLNMNKSRFYVLNLVGKSFMVN